jgi:tRNA pseudouridine55 synthase
VKRSTGTASVAPGTASAPPVRSGLLAVDKPPGVTSHDVVEQVRHRLAAKGAGHLGTLDPFASGLLLVAVGAATRCVTVWQAGEKTYEGTLRLGVVTDTQDLTGEILERHEVAVTEDAVRAAALAFVGDIAQVPPMVSALKVRGERLYRLARRGETVERAPRPVRVAAWEWLAFALPEARFRVRCSGGTYVRTLAHDLGQRLSTGAALAELRRLRSEPFTIERAVPLADLHALEAHEAWARGGIPLEEALAFLPQLRLEAAQAEAVGYGGRPLVPRAAAVPAPLGAGPRSVVLRGPEGEFLALGGLEPEGAAEVRVCPHVVFPWAVREGRP